MLLFVVASAFAGGVAVTVEKVNAALLPGVTVTAVDTALAPVDVARFAQGSHDWTLSCQKGAQPGAPTCKAKSGDVVRAARTAEISGGQLVVTFEGKDSYSGYNFLLEISG